jgi:glycosyltransferase involved in cell wall biosynthesis
MSYARRTWIITTTLNNVQLQGAFIPMLRAMPDLELVLVTDRIGVPIERVRYVVPASWSVKLFGRLIPRQFKLFGAVRGRSVERVMAYNAVPHLLLAYLAAGFWRKPLDLQMIGGTNDLDFSWRPQLNDNRIIRRLKNPRRLEKFFRWIALGHCDRFFTTGSVAKQWLIEHGIPSDRIFATPGCVDTERFQPGEETRDIDVLVVASILERKRPQLTIKIFEGVHAARPETRFTWIGNGFMRDQIHAAVAASPLREAVTFVDRTEEIPAFYRRAKVFLLNSALEGLPQATMEAMASHCVPVCSNVGDARDIILNGETGFSVEQDEDPAPYVAAILDLLKDEPMRARMALAARDLIIRDHSYPARVESWRRVK